MRLIVQIIVSSLTTISFSFGCNSQEQIEQSQSLAKQGLTFRAIDVLETALERCYHPRIKLELGTLYLQLGDDETAINWWQSALENDDLPDNVTTSVKLRILQAQLSPPQPGQAHLVFSIGTRYQQTVGFDSSGSLLGIGRLNGSPVNSFGYPLTPALYAKVSVSQRYYWQNDATDTTLMLEPGLRADSQPISVLVGPRLMSHNNNLDTGARAKLALRSKHTELTSELDWTTTRQQLRFSQAVRLTGKDGYWEVLAKAEHEQQWQWKNLVTEIRLNHRWRPKLQLDYELPTRTASSYIQASWPLSKTVRLQTQIGLTFSEIRQWQGKFILNWQPF